MEDLEAWIIVACLFSIPVIGIIALIRGYRESKLEEYDDGVEHTKEYYDRDRNR